jgi:UDP:flavonoid glycosyltransferase YjiC (YdhE family)
LSRILIFAEAVTLAHVARPIALSRVLRQLGHDVCIAASEVADRWLEGEPVSRQTISSIDPSRFLGALARGAPPYDVQTLKRYVQDDLRAIAAWSPEIVIGDFRLSLYISARLAQIPYGAIANAYWSRRYWPGVAAPSVPVLDWLSQPLADATFRLVYPIAFALHARPFRRACDHFGVESPGPDIRDIYTASDATAFADAEACYEPDASKAGATFIGPLSWQPVATEPLPIFEYGDPIVFVTLGSSGRTEMLPRLLAMLEQLPVRYIVAGESMENIANESGRCIFASPFINYADACARAVVTICNGGAPATYASLGAGTPVIGVVSNLDQVLNMRTVERLGAGLALRWRNADTRDLHQAIITLTSSSVVNGLTVTSRSIAANGNANEAISGWMCSIEKARAQRVST